MFANPRQVESARDLTLAARQAPRSRPGEHVLAAVGPLARVRVRRAQGRPAKRPSGSRSSTSRGWASIPRSCGSTRRDRSPPRCSATRVSTTRASRGSSGRSTEPSAGVAGQPDHRQGPVRPRTRRRRDEAGDTGQERQAHDRPPDPGEGRGGAPEHGLALGRPRRDGDRAWIPTPETSSRWRRHPGSTRTASRRPARIGAGTAQSPTRTSRARRSSS